MQNRLSKIVWSNGIAREVKSFMNEKLPFALPAVHEINDNKFEQCAKYISETDVSINVYMSCQRPPVIKNLTAFNIKYGFSRFLELYCVDFNKNTQEISYKAYAPLSANPVGIVGNYEFKYLGVTYDKAGSPMGDLELYVTCDVENVKNICARARTPPPKAHIIIDKNDIISITCNVKNPGEIRAVQYHDIRSFSIS